MRPRATRTASLDTHVLPAFGRRRLDSVTPDDVARWAQRMRTLGYRLEADRRVFPETAEQAPGRPAARGDDRTRARDARRVYAHAIRRQGFAGTSPVAAWSVRSDRATTRRSGHPDAPATRRSDRGGDTDLHTGPRLSRRHRMPSRRGPRRDLGVTWADLDLAEGTVRIAAQLDRSGRRTPLKTRNSRRTIDLPGSLVDLLVAHRSSAVDTRSGALVFSTALGGALDRGRSAAGRSRADQVTSQASSRPACSPSCRPTRSRRPDRCSRAWLSEEQWRCA